MFDLAAHQRERIRALERDNHGLEQLRDHLIRTLANIIEAYEAKLEIQALTQDEFMRELQLESDSFHSRPEGHLELVGSRSKSPSGRTPPRVELVSASNRQSREAS
jgi:hypothetical protein